MQDNETNKDDIRYSYSVKSDEESAESKYLKYTMSGVHKDSFLEKLADLDQQEQTSKHNPEPQKPKQDDVIKEIQKKLKQQEINRLSMLLSTKDKEFQKAKGKRTMITTTFFAIFYFVIIVLFRGITDITDIFYMDLGEIALLVVISTICAWLHFWANGVIFGQLSEMGRRERETLDNIRKNIKEVEKSGTQRKG